jgi:hypothetical protein
MTNVDQLAGVVEDLIQVMHLQTKELEQLVARVGQVTHLGYDNQMPLIASELSALRQWIVKLREP